MFMGQDVGDSLGSPVATRLWNLAEGFTAFGTKPGSPSSIPLLRVRRCRSGTSEQSGAKRPGELRHSSGRVGARSTLTTRSTDSVSTQVTSDVPVVVERTMRFSGQGHPPGPRRSLSRASNESVGPGILWYSLFLPEMIRYLVSEWLERLAALEIGPEFRFPEIRRRLPWLALLAVLWHRDSAPLEVPAGAHRVG